MILAIACYHEQPTGLFNIAGTLEGLERFSYSILRKTRRCIYLDTGVQVD